MDYSELDQGLPEPAPIHLRYDQLTPQTEFSPHSHPWGQLNCISLGVIELSLIEPGQAERALAAPAEFLIWVPAGIRHSASVRQAMRYTSVYVGAEQAAGLPAHPCLIPQTPLLRALLDDFCQRGVTSIQDPWDRRQAELLLARLSQAGHQDSYLPDSRHRQLAPILAAIRDNPADAATLAQWAQRVHGTERTLARHFQRELGMSFVQWRNRVRLLRALAWLREGRPVQDIAADLGYGTASAFIAMFNKQLGYSPERYRRLLADGAR
ncbi:MULTISPECIES: AraC family transcriptional regulator [Chromobacterium]|uniref:AraC family transcriptional regulator n=1 Tax=Chromobacterium TaxID=535 RepID=UPI0018895AC8|nr:MULTISPECIES: helix-turn-helix transcriptional regulator [Chromobacterium]QOZ84273.1 AraC family transcriptional regulator [Chromobacterium sp. Rain0013]WON84450.1 helix-turn-helix transcriptional regulator [Chromobacterium haemolyticum]